MRRTEGEFSAVQLLLIFFGAGLTGVAGSTLNVRLGLSGWSGVLLPLFMVGITAMVSSGIWPLRQRLQRLEAELRRLEARLAEKQPPSTAP